jgi:hypothetical protein
VEIIVNRASSPPWLEAIDSKTVESWWGELAAAEVITAVMAAGLADA